MTQLPTEPAIVATIQLTVGRWAVQGKTAVTVHADKSSADAPRRSSCSRSVGSDFTATARSTKLIAVEVAP